MRQPTAIAILILLTVLPLPVLAQNKRLVDSGCRQGFCWETYVLGKKVIRQDQMNGKPQTFYLVDLENKTSRGIDRRQDWVQCSTTEPFVAFTSPVFDPDKVSIRHINPGASGNQIPNAIIPDHLMYWAICHNEWQPNLSNMAGKARSLGYSLNLQNNQRDVPKVEFIASMPATSPVSSNAQSNRENSTVDTPLTSTTTQSTPPESNSTPTVSCRDPGYVFTQIGDAGQTSTCYCSPARTGFSNIPSYPGSIWGTDIYYELSNICKAAVHAGRITHKGGVVTLKIFPGQRSPGTKRNGITSTTGGNTQPERANDPGYRSFGFVSSPTAEGVCAEAIASNTQQFNGKLGLSRWWATAGNKDEKSFPVTWTVTIKQDGTYRLNVVFL